MQGSFQDEDVFGVGLNGLPLAFEKGEGGFAHVSIYLGLGHISLTADEGKDVGITLLAWPMRQCMWTSRRRSPADRLGDSREIHELYCGLEICNTLLPCDLRCSEGALDL